MKFEETTEKIIQAFYKVYNTLGYGFLEKVYERAMLIELAKLNLKCENQIPINVFYEGKVIGEFFADILVEDKIIVELKAISKLTKQDESQLLHYLNATDKEIGLLLNFGPKAEIKRKAFDNNLKKYIRKEQ
jgi:GxxExxY protein